MSGTLAPVSTISPKKAVSVAKAAFNNYHSEDILVQMYFPAACVKHKLFVRDYGIASQAAVESPARHLEVVAYELDNIRNSS